MGPTSARIVDAHEELCRDFAFPVLQWQAKYEGIYLLGTSIARPLISRSACRWPAKSGPMRTPTGRPARGTTSAGSNWRPRPSIPSVKIIAPWRIEKFRQQFPGRTEMIAYCDAKKIPVKASVAKPYSSDENCLHISYEAGKLEDPAVNGVDIVDFGMTVSPQAGAGQGRRGDDRLRAGVPVQRQRQRRRRAGDGRPNSTQIGGRNGIGRIDMVENRFVGMKSRGVYEAPGMTMLYAAHRASSNSRSTATCASARPPRAGSGRDGVLRLLVRPRWTR